MNLFLSLYLAALFVALTPGVLLTLPKGGARITVAVVHALVFAVIYNLTYRMVWRTSVTMDGFQGGSAQLAAQANMNMLRMQGSKPGQGSSPMASIQNANLAQQAAAARAQQQEAVARAKQAAMASQRAGSR